MILATKCLDVLSQCNLWPRPSARNVFCVLYSGYLNYWCNHRMKHRNAFRILVRTRIFWNFSVSKTAVVWFRSRCDLNAAGEASFHGTRAFTLLNRALWPKRTTWAGDQTTCILPRPWRKPSCHRQSMFPWKRRSRRSLPHTHTKCRRWCCREHQQQGSSGMQSTCWKEPLAVLPLPWFSVFLRTCPLPQKNCLSHRASLLFRGEQRSTYLGGLLGRVCRKASHESQVSLQAVQ